ncbi:MAG: sodium-extruding oxaloacetate decarboxylase subunit alpha [Thermoplasmata archaeon]|nr:sodium-extruding oxaloacetate decarboxylase subunit alpha [Thermoplasmata archaeon]
MKLTDTIFRDAHQSLLVTRMRTRDMLPIAEKMNEIDWFSLEVWGGATFDVAIRYLNEDPWDRIRSLKKAMPDIPMQMLLRGQNIVGYHNYPDDILIKFVERAAANGVDIFRIFDALNDIRNLEVAIKTAKKCDSHVQGCISYTISPVHTVEKFADFAVKLAELEVDSICIKDMAGMITPRVAYKLIKGIKKEVNLPVNLHTHSTSGMALMTYFSAAEAGVDILDTAISPLSGGTSQPPCESVIAGFEGTPYDTGIDIQDLTEIVEYFRKLKEKYRGVLDPISERVDTRVLIYQVPGGMFSNLVDQLKKQNALDRLEDVLREIPKVRKELGYPPLVTPTSQVVGVQGVVNVLTGKRYSVISEETKKYVKGMYGKTPAPVDPEIKKIIIGDEKPITCRPADMLEPEWERRKKELAEIKDKNGEPIETTDENVLIYSIFPVVGATFLKREAVEESFEPHKPAEKSKGPSKPKEKPKERPAEAPAVGIPTEFKVEVDGEEFEVKIEPKGGFVALGPGEKETKTTPEIPNPVKVPMGGLITQIKVNVGDKVKKGDILAVLEAMKMENNIESKIDGEVNVILVSEGKSVEKNDTIIGIV